MYYFGATFCSKEQRILSPPLWINIRAYPKQTWINRLKPKCPRGHAIRLLSAGFHKLPAEEQVSAVRDSVPQSVAVIVTASGWRRLILASSAYATFRLATLQSHPSQPLVAIEWGNNDSLDEFWLHEEKEDHMQRFQWKWEHILLSPSSLDLQNEAMSEFG